VSLPTVSLKSIGTSTLLDIARSDRDRNVCLFTTQQEGWFEQQPGVYVIRVKIGGKIDGESFEPLIFDGYIRYQGGTELIIGSITELESLYSIKNSSFEAGHTVDHTTQSQLVVAGSGTELAVSSVPDHDPIYALEDQEWYPRDFPRTKDITPEEALRYQPDIDVVLITVNDAEFRAVMHQLKPLPSRRIILQVAIENETYYLGKFGSQRAVVTTCRMGSSRSGGATHVTDRACRIWLPRAVLMTGVAFGADPKTQQIGDVLVADQIINYEPERVGSTSQFRGDPIVSAPGLLSRFQHTHNWKFLRPDNVQCRRIIGPVLSGEKLVDDPGFKAKLLKQFPKAIGGEMEGAGLSASSLYNNTPWILIKAICDWADGSKDKRHQPLAAAAARGWCLSCTESTRCARWISKEAYQII